MAMNLDAILKITAKVAGVDDLGRLEKGLIGAEKAASGAKEGFKGMISSSLWQGAAVAAAAIGTGIGLATRAAIQFEAAMTEVRKVVDGLDDQASFEKIQSEVLNLSKELPIAAEGFAAIYAAAGQSGIARGELEGFARVVSNVATAFDLTADEAGTALAQTKVALGLTIDETALLADAMNHLSNRTGASGVSLVEFMRRAAASGKIAGLAGEQTAAFGAAMIQTGVQSEVAATAFRNMVGALSKGPGMTDRQAGALERLGYAMGDAARDERRLTSAVEEESQRRLDVARAETDRLLKELNRRYRDQERMISDQMDDETDAIREAVQDRADAQIEGLRRQQRYEVEAARQRAEVSGRSADAEIQAIEDIYDKRIDAVQDGLRVEVKAIDRNARDKRQAISDQLEDQRALEVEAVQSRFNEVQKVENARRDEGIAAAKESAKATADGFKQAFSDGFQRDALGTLREVLGRIANLPEAQQLSTLTEVFGEEAARGIAPLLSNLGELDRILGLVAGSGQYAGSVAAEAGIRAAATDKQLQTFWNNLRALAIEIGKTVLPALVSLAQFLTPIVEGLSKFAQQNPILTTTITLLAGAFAALVAAAPFIAGVLVSLEKMGIVLTGLGPLLAGLGVQWAGVLTVIQVAFGGFLTWLTTTALPAILAFFSGPVGWTVLAVAAVVAMCLFFREPIMEFFDWLGSAIGEGLLVLWEWGEPIRKFWIDLWDSIRDIAAGFFTWLPKAIAGWLGGVMSVIRATLLTPWLALWLLDMRTPVAMMVQWLQGTLRGLGNLFSQQWRIIGGYWDTYVVSPVVDTWEGVTDMFSRQLRMLVGFFSGAWEAVRDGFNGYIVQPIKSMWDAIIGYLKGGFNGFLKGFEGVVNTVVNIINRLISAFNALPGPDIGFLPTFNVPQFAQGGVVSAPTLAMVGEGGEQEYVIPESKMLKASANYMAGARGSDVLGPAVAAAPSSSASSPIINIQTGPVMEFNGDRWVKVEDLNRAMQQTADAVLGRMRTPRVRMAAGLR